jgi:hypothetical protein
VQIWKLGDLDSHRKQGEPVSDITEHYAAPEIATAMLKGANVLADAKMDIFSLGLVAYEVLAGVAFLPTSAFDKDAALRALGGSGLDALLQKQLAPLPQQFKGLLQHMLKVSPGERKRAQELRQDGALTGQVHMHMHMHMHIHIHIGTCSRFRTRPRSRLRWRHARLLAGTGTLTSCSRSAAHLRLLTTK